MANVKGNLIPLTTAFTDDGRTLSEVRMARQVHFWVDRGAPGFYLSGETGEFLTVVTSERKAALEIVQRECQGCLPIVVNVSSLSTSLSLDLAQHAGRHGATAAFVTPPYFGRYTQREMFCHLRAIVGLAGLPLIIGDLYGAVQDGLAAALANMPQVEFASGIGFDIWTSENASVDVIATLSELFPDTPRELLDTGYAEFGPAVLMKAAFERLGTDLGAPRSPKAVLDAAELTQLLQLAA